MLVSQSDQEAQTDVSGEEQLVEHGEQEMDDDEDDYCSAVAGDNLSDQEVGDCSSDGDSTTPRSGHSTPERVH